MLDEKTLRSGLRTRVFGRKIYTFASIDSTNNCAKAVAGCGAEEGTVVLAEEQTAGRGRMGRSWIADPDKNLTFSVLLRPRVPPEHISLFSLYAAIAIAKAVEQLTGLTVECKWPNDLLIKGKKFSGILLEGAIKQNAVDFVIIGIGVNVNQESFPTDFASRATSLLIESRKVVRRDQLFREILVQLESHYTRIASHGPATVVPEWVGRSAMINQPVSVSLQGETITGVVKGVSPEGGLVLSVGNTERTLYAGDTTIVKQ
jgi:BirA family biotin operon repressor/biotin-[acetyl-CoA-carboxylase] ligase